MADTTTEQAIAISTGIVGALHAAGMLHPGGMQVAQAAATPPQPELQEGQFVSVQIRQFAKFTGTNPPAVRVLLTNADSPTTYELEFPPNDETYLPEFHRLQTIDRPIQISANLRITGKNSATGYVCELTGLWVNTGFRA